MAPRNSPLTAWGQVWQLCTERSVAQERLAQRSRVDRSCVGGIERRERNVGLDRIIGLAEALDVESGRAAPRHRVAFVPRQGQ